MRVVRSVGRCGQMAAWGPSSAPQASQLRKVTEVRLTGVLPRSPLFFHDTVLCSPALPEMSVGSGITSAAHWERAAALRVLLRCRPRAGHRRLLGQLAGHRASAALWWHCCFSSRARGCTELWKGELLLLLFLPGFRSLGGRLETCCAS